MSIAVQRAELAVDAVLPGDPTWDEARAAWNLQPDQRPAAVAYPTSAEEVAAVVDYARERGLRVAPQATGHFAGSLGSLDGAILLKTGRMRGVEIDAPARWARVDAGVVWAEVAGPAAAHGLAGLSGSAPDVGVVGYTLGGGLGWLARRYGLAANSVQAVELVTADGSFVRADADEEPDLFWAVRGGGGSFGVVTALEFSLHPAPELYAGSLFWPIERAAEVLHGWAQWVETVPDELTSLGRLLRFPPIPAIPEHLRGRAFVLVEAAFLGDEAGGSELLGPLRALDPELDTFEAMLPTSLGRVHMDPEEPVSGVGDGTMLEELPPAAVDALVRAAGPDSGSALVSVEVRHLGGAVARPGADHGAVGTLDAGFALFAVGMALDPDMTVSTRAQVAAVRSALAPWEAERSFFNFTERQSDTPALFGAETAARLGRIKAGVDPDGMFQVVHPVAPA